jgi:hypothetical protein
MEQGSIFQWLRWTKRVPEENVAQRDKTNQRERDRTN